MKIVLVGATGMVGSGMLLECLDSPLVDSVLVIARRSLAVTHPKYREIIQGDLSNADSYRAALAGYDAAFYALGISTVGVDEAEYTRVTKDLTIMFAEAFQSASPNGVFVFVSGRGADATEQSRVVWARVKGATENALRHIGFRAVYIFRPGVIQPMRGVKSRTGWYNIFYAVFGPLLSLARRVSPGSINSTVDIGRAAIEVAAHGFPVELLGTAEIHRAAQMR